MKVIIAGCRNPEQANSHLHIIITNAMEEAGWLSQVEEVVSGGSRGVDSAGETWGIFQGLQVTIMLADWNKHGKAAGPIRNRKMAEHADCLLALWDGKSRGTKNMIDTMKSLGKPVHVHYLERS